MRGACKKAKQLTSNAVKIADFHQSLSDQDVRRDSFGDD